MRDNTKNGCVADYVYMSSWAQSCLNKLPLDQQGH